MKSNDKQFTINDKRPKIDIDHIAKLANLHLTKSEKQKFEGQIGDILEFINQIQEISQKYKEELDGKNLDQITDQDLPRPSLEIDKVLGNAPKAKDKYFTTKAVFSND
ncbi:MAG TPA: Asp-tRNA(Asn)/Glu-tRNA(Gln) amidotransferase subunit GatC [Patescibacteria group bacterium]